MTLADSFQRLVEERDAALAEVERLRGEIGDALIHCDDCRWPEEGVCDSNRCQILADALEGR